MKWIQFIVFIIKDLILDAHEKIRTKTPTPTITTTPTMMVWYQCMRNSPPAKGITK
jgi:hypothetical protein